MTWARSASPGAKRLSAVHEVVEAFGRLFESGLAVERDRQAPQRLGRRRIGVDGRLGGAARVLEMAEPPERFRGEHERGDPDGGRFVVQVAVGDPEGAEGMVGAGAGVFLQRGHGILVRFGALVAMFGRDVVEPAGRDGAERLG